MAVLDGGRWVVVVVRFQEWTPKSCEGKSSAKAAAKTLGGMRLAGMPGCVPSVSSRNRQLNCSGYRAYIFNGFAPTVHT